MAKEQNLTILEVGPRDGFQNLVEFIPTEKKAQIIQKLVDAGVRYIEFASFVHPKWIPQLADAAELYSLIKDRPGVTYRALIPNEKGLERALEKGVKEVTWVVCATDRGNLANLNMTTEQSLEMIRRIGTRVKRAGAKFCGSIAYALGDPIEGDVPIEKIFEIVRVFRQVGATDVSIADSIGIASPLKIRKMFPELANEFPDVRWSIHLHNILGLGIANALAAWEVGVTTLESSIAGLGGCPYAPYPGGNVATEELVYLFNKLGVHSGINLDKLMEARDFVRSIVGEKPKKQVGHPEEK
ncbi:MAG: hydroxymethylglutaryl-CoA lyase [Deltaproteobacteria bacterium]|nr:hydroxymethylglutaryl-CoA lyase [Deltaproteobacteria bacterium]